MSELVSCVMATGNRPSFFQQALRCFERQNYQDAELIVVDDGEFSVGDFCAGRDRVRYIRLDQPASTGAKLNIAIEQARGTILQKLDDDDYYSPGFLATLVYWLPRSNRERALVVRDCFFVLLAGERQIRDSGHGWTPGGTLCFGRELWERIPFRDLRKGEDHWFLVDHDPDILAVCAPEQYWLVRHGANTWTMMQDGETADDCMRRLPFREEPLEAFLDPDDCAYYRSLRRAEPG